MAASYPAGLKTFTTKAAGGSILSAHINDLQNEVVAVETTLGVNAGITTAYTPTWTASITNPTLGNSTFTGKYVKIGKLVIAWVYLLVGSTANMGSGTYYFSLPVAAYDHTNYLMGTWAFYRIGIGNLTGALRYTSSTTISLAVDGAIYLTHASPNTVASGDKFNMMMTYLSA